MCVCVCTGALRDPAVRDTNQCNWYRRFEQASVRVLTGGLVTTCFRGTNPSFSVALICTGTRRDPAARDTNYGNWNRRFGQASVRVLTGRLVSTCFRGTASERKGNYMYFFKGNQGQNLACPTCAIFLRYYLTQSVFKEVNSSTNPATNPLP